MSRDEVKKILAKLTIMYPHFTVGESICGLKPTDVWLQIIGDMDYARADKALQVCTNRCKFPPTAADIREEYDAIVAAEKKQTAEINRFYEQSRSYYPGSGDIGYGKAEFTERAKTPEQAERLYKAIVRYVNSCEKETMDFAECVRTIK